MGVCHILSNASVVTVQPLLLCTQLADLSYEQCTRQTRREGAACSATGLGSFSADAETPHHCCESNKVKVVPYSSTSVRHGADPGFLAGCR